jgi:integrase/recombinase XerD
MKNVFLPDGFKVLSPSMQDLLLAKCNVQYKVIALFMMDAGLRVSEVMNLRVKHINTLNKTVFVESLKKRKPEYREVPMSERLLDAMTDYWQKMKDRQPDAFLFPQVKDPKKHKDRRSVWRRLKKYTDGAVHPHMLRHTCATRIVNEGKDFDSLRAAQKILGHKSISTTEIYTHVSREQMVEAIQSIEKTSWPERLSRKLFPKKRIHIVPVEQGLTQFHIGRKEELKRLADLTQKKINTLILGAQGVGKSHLLDNYKSPNLIRVGEFKSNKEVLGGLLLAILEREPERAEFILQVEESRVNEIVMRKAPKFLIHDLVAVTKKHEFTLVIDDVTTITPTAVTGLEKLKNHFHIICAARRVPVEKATFLTNFERIELKPLARPEAMELIARLSKPFLNRIEDYEAYKNHIWENTNGVPLYVCEMVERYGKEADINTEIIKDIRHTAALQEINFAPFVVGVLACMTVLRYWSRISGEDAGPFYLLAALGLVFLIFGRGIIAATKKKYI